MENVLLIGAGNMACDYLRVLEDLKCNCKVIGRGENSAKNFEKKTGHRVITGGLDAFLKSHEPRESRAIIAVGVEKLYETTKLLLEYGVKDILVEKPGALSIEQFKELVSISNEKRAKVYIAYNRRFYASVLAAEEIIKNDGGLISFDFEFTEWSHKIEPLVKAKGVKEKWFLSNSTHVVDLAFFLGGKPKEITSYTSRGVEWHSRSSVFAGAGITNNHVLFNYHANWESAGRWAVNLLTSRHKLIFEPLEKLQLQDRGSLERYYPNIDYSLDELYKPGLYLETKKFITDNTSDLCSLNEQADMFRIYNQIANYN